jgi:AraC-like DNA-binding protein
MGLDSAMERPRALVETRPTGNGRARGLVSSRISGGRIESRTYAPSADLADVIECHWIGRWDLRGEAPHVTELLGDPTIHLALEEGSSRLVGVWTRLWRRSLEGLGQVRATKLRPGAARAFLPRAASTYTNTLTPLASVFGPLGTLEAEVLGPADDAEAFVALEAWLRARRLTDEDGQRSLATALVQRIATDPSLARVESLAELAGLSVRELQRLFRAHVGATPKHVLRRVRLQEAALRVERGEVVSLARLAAELGYTDQAHLARDFKLATGKTLRAFGRDVWR